MSAPKPKQQRWSPPTSDPELTAFRVALAKAVAIENPTAAKYGQLSKAKAAFCAALKAQDGVSCERTGPDDTELTKIYPTSDVAYSQLQRLMCYREDWIREQKTARETVEKLQEETGVRRGKRHASANGSDLLAAAKERDAKLSAVKDADWVHNIDLAIMERDKHAKKTMSEEEEAKITAQEKQAGEDRRTNGFNTFKADRKARKQKGTKNGKRKSHSPGEEDEHEHESDPEDGDLESVMKASLEEETRLIKIQRLGYDREMDLKEKEAEARTIAAQAAMAQAQNAAALQQQLFTLLQNMPGNYSVQNMQGKQ